MKLRNYPGTSSILTRSAAGASESPLQSGNGCATIEHSVPGSKVPNTETLDDLEQRFLRFTITVREMCDSAISILDDEEDQVKMTDRISNVLIGMKEYVHQSESDIADDIENHISKQYKKGKFTYYASIKEDNVLELPPELVEILEWKEGDTLLWTDLHDGSYQLTKVV